MLVLIVDDERVVAESTAEIFRHAGHQAWCAFSAAEALQTARAVRPQLVITDVIMPGETGIALAIQIVAEVPSCKILLISGQAETTNLLETAEQQGYRFEIVAKPLWPPDLLARANQLVAETAPDSSSEAATASE